MTRRWFALIGPNGAGKTTLFSLVSGALPPQRGDVFFEGRRLTGAPMHEIARQGVVRTFQLSRLCGNFTVLEHVLTALPLHTGVRFWPTILDPRRTRSRERQLEKQARDMFQLVGLDDHEHEIAASLPHGLQRVLQAAIALAPGPKLLLLGEPVTGMNQVEVDEVIDLIRRLLKTRARQLAGSLSGGEQQLLAFARGLMARPKVLLVDEPTVGVAPLLVQELGRTLREINRQGVAILLVEQNAAMALRLAQRGYVLETGRIVLSGKTDDLLQNDYVRKSYLGK